jgi:thiol-disulfide isomerase/thioredoxin
VKLHIAEKWYVPYATWSSEEQIQQWKDEVANNKMNRMDMPAPPIEPLLILPPEHFKAAALDTAIKNDIHAGRVVQDFRKEMKSKLTVLFFWDINCGHCKSSIQELFAAWEEVKNDDLQVITVQVVASKEAKGKWIDFVNEHNMFGWVNAWSPYAYSHENHFRETYNLSAVPKMYLLDENSIIVLKNIVPEQLKEIIPKK